MRILVTGAAGFVGRQVTAALLADPAHAASEVVLNDLDLSGAPADPRIRAVAGDLGTPALRQALLDGGIDIAFHLAGILGGAAEADYALSRRVNIDACLSLFEELRNEAKPPRVVFCSTIAVFGTPLPAEVDDATEPRPSMTYGAQKLMMEAVIGQFSRRGWIDGLAIRLPGIVARRGADARQKAAFLNNIFYAFVDGAPFTMPVSPDGTTWLMSVPRCIANILHAGSLPRERIGERRAFNLPALRVQIDELVAALGTSYSGTKAAVTYAPQPDIEAQFARYPPLRTPTAEALGFTHDGTLAALIEAAVAPPR